jgi:hypothetical protein
MGERMFEVTKYEPPQIFVTSRRTGETYKFLVGIDGAVNDEALFDQGDARRAAITYLAQRARANVALSRT